MRYILTDRKFRVPRIWSNQELRRFAPIFTGDVVNVSAWQDADKQGGHYRDYFTACRKYHRTNYKSEARGFQGEEGEIFLDLTDPLPASLRGRYDVVFNHTVLEHIFDVQTAFANLCAMSRDAVIIVVPFMQQMHAKYGDYWRFTPTCLQNMFSQQGFTPLYTSYNNHLMASTYIFMVAVRDPEKWQGKIPDNRDKNGLVPFSARACFPDGLEKFVGVNTIPNIGYSLRYALSKLRR